jgi:hypothetical protein
MRETPVTTMGVLLMAFYIGGSMIVNKVYAGDNQYDACVERYEKKGWKATGSWFCKTSQQTPAP